MRTSQDCWSCFRRVTLWRQKLTIIKCDCCIDEERYYKDHYTRRRIECHGETRYSTYVIRIFSVFFGNDSFSHKNQRIQNPPHAGDAAHNSYVSGNKKRQECFEGTRETILGEIEAWIVRRRWSSHQYTSRNCWHRKSTVTQTIAQRATNLGLLGASFFFSRNEDYRSNGKLFFSTIAVRPTICVQYWRSTET
jgi:hypothetical protein